MSFTSVDLPEPETPVTTVITPSGNVTSRFFRLFSRAPRMRDRRAVRLPPLRTHLDLRSARDVSPGQRIRHVLDLRRRAMRHQLRRHAVPRRGRGQSRNPPAGWSLRRAPPPARCCPDRAIPPAPSAGVHCRDDAVRSKAHPAHTSTPRSFDPICVASRMRCPSPPESVAAERSSEM